MAAAPSKPAEPAPEPRMSKPSAMTETAKPAASKPAATADAPKPESTKTTMPDKDAEPKTTSRPRMLAQADRTTPPSVRDVPERRERTRAAPSRADAAEGGDYYIQVGAFKDQAAAKRLVATLRAQNYQVEESVKRIGGGGAMAEAVRPAPRAPAMPATPAVGGTGSDRYDVIVTGGSPSEINSKLAAKGLAAEPAGDGVRIRPSLPLRDAVALSKDLNNDGFKVQVRRGGGRGPVAATPPSAPERSSTASDGPDAGGGDVLYRVRVGGYPDRATAQTALRALQAKGYQPFMTKGRE
jgi:cell division septation protein DedD